MIIDMHAHYVPLESQSIAVEIGNRHKLRLENDERDRPIVTRNGVPYLGALKRNSTILSFVA
jgi:hypothetical protein